MKYFNFFLVLSFFVGMLACKDVNTTQNQEATLGKEAIESTVENAIALKTVVFFGTSLTAGYGLSEEEAYPNLIQQKIKDKKLPYKVVNAGLSGETTTDGINRIDWVLQQKVDVFVVELGANDALRGQPVANAAKNLQIIVDAVKTKYPDCKLVVIGMMAPPNLGTSYTSAFQKLFPALAEKNKAALVPFLLEGVAANPALNQADGIHPTAEGQKIVAETVWKVLETVL